MNQEEALNQRLRQQEEDARRWKELAKEAEKLIRPYLFHKLSAPWLAKFDALQQKEATQ